MGKLTQGEALSARVAELPPLPYEQQMCASSLTTHCLTDQGYIERLESFQTNSGWNRWVQAAGLSMARCCRLLD